MSNPQSRGAALVTGASTGIGAIYADRLARRGHDLILVARDAARLKALATKLAADTGVKVDVVAADLTDDADLAAVAHRLETDPAITLLVNNAGAALGASFLEATPDQLDKLIALNIGALTRLAHAAAKAFVARGRGDIINIGSVVGLRPEFKMHVYGATKAYVLYLTQAIDQEVADSGVRLQAVLPGATRTEIWERSGLDAASLDPSHVMEASELVDAALAGFDQGDLVTIPSLPETADWDALQAAFEALAPNLSHNHPAPRFRAKVAEPA